MFTAELMFQGWLYSNESIENWREAAEKSDIYPTVMMQFALLYWLHKKRAAPLEVELIRFTKLIRAICSLVGTFMLKGLKFKIVWFLTLANKIVQS